MDDNTHVWNKNAWFFCAERSARVISASNNTKSKWTFLDEHDVLYIQNTLAFMRNKLSVNKKTILSCYRNKNSELRDTI